MDHAQILDNDSDEEDEEGEEHEEMVQLPQAPTKLALPDAGAQFTSGSQNQLQLTDAAALGSGKVLSGGSRDNEGSEGGSEGVGEGGGIRLAQRAAPTRKHAARMADAPPRGSLVFGHKTITPSLRTTLLLLLPFLLWEASLVVIYSVSFVELQSMQQPLVGAACLVLLCVAVVCFASRSCDLLCLGSAWSCVVTAPASARRKTVRKSGCIVGCIELCCVAGHVQLRFSFVSQLATSVT